MHRQPRKSSLFPYKTLSRSGVSAQQLPPLCFPGAQQLPQLAAAGRVVSGLVGVLLRRLLLGRSEEHTSELQSQSNLVCRLLLEKKNNKKRDIRPLLRHPLTG